MNYSEYTFVFDIDGTICPIKKKDEKYEDLVPFPDIVEKLKEWHVELEDNKPEEIPPWKEQI